jgi:hypothetical protein
MSDDLIKIRDMAESDKGFIYSTWLNAVYFGNKWAKDVDPIKGAPIDVWGEIEEGPFYACYRNVIEKLLARCITKIACLKEDEDVILGYANYENDVLHFVFVKDAWRRVGIAKKLVPKGITSITHLTKIGHYAKRKSWKYNPFLI